MIGSPCGASPDKPRPASLATPHGALRLPAFLPDATRAVIRCLDADDLRACGVQGLVVNTFHLTTHPGVTVVSALGGVHSFMGWSGPVLSDSGGFQVYSLLSGSRKQGSVTRRGFTYRVAPGAGKKVLTPEKCIRAQFQLGADVIVCLDHCVPLDAPPEQQREALENTVLWAGACGSEFERLAEQTGRRPLLFAVVQGGKDQALRRECAERLVEIGFDGYGYGGWPVDKEGRLLDVVGAVAEMIPAHALRWALGIGKPEHVVRSVACGYDLFDCVIPTRDARHGRLYAFTGPPGLTDLDADGFYECVYPLDRKHVRDPAPVDATCDCPCCGRYSRAYLHHLFRIRDPLGFRVATVQNLRFYARLMELLRADAAERR